jgi:hypothetical protein
MSINEWMNEWMNVSSWTLPDFIPISPLARCLLNDCAWIKLLWSSEFSLTVSLAVACSMCVWINSPYGKRISYFSVGSDKKKRECSGVQWNNGELDTPTPRSYEATDNQALTVPKHDKIVI